MKPDHVDVSNNTVAALAVFAERVRGTDVTANDNGAPGCTSCAAIYAFNAAKLVGLNSSGNAGYGAFGITSLRLQNSSVTNNNGRGLGLDVAARGNLLGVDTICGLNGSGDPAYTAGSRLQAYVRGATGEAWGRRMAMKT